MPVIRELSVFKDIGIQKIGCGSRHILALNNCGALFSAGNNCCGQLGFDDRLKINTPGVCYTSLRYDILVPTSEFIIRSHRNRSWQYLFSINGWLISRTIIAQCYYFFVNFWKIFG